MRRTIDSALDVDQSIDTAWAVLTDFPGYSVWNPVISRISGKADFGAHILLRLVAPGLAPRNLDAMLLRMHPQREMLWIARTLFPGILDIEYHALLEKIDSGGTRLRQEVTLGGILTLFVWRRLEPILSSALDTQGHAFAQHCRDASKETSLSSNGKMT